MAQPGQTPTVVTGDQIRAIVGILGLDHVPFEDIAMVTISPRTVEVTTRPRNGEEPATVVITMAVRWS